MNLRFLILIFSFITSSFSIVIYCKFENTDWSTEVNHKVIPIISSYSCIAEIIGIPVYPEVSDIAGSHIFGKGNGDVKMVQIAGQLIKKMPRGMENHFPNLMGLFINHCNLTKITKEDLKPYKYLKYFSVRDNLLKTIDGNLLQYNPDLKFVSFGHNPIEKVGENLLKNLHHLQKVSFIKTKCINKAAIHDYKQVEALKEELIQKCSKK